MTAWTWRTWPDPLVDFGRELYIAWQLSIGRALYTDNAYFDGPLAPHLNALWMKLFGANMATIIAVNFIVMVGTLCLIYFLLQRAAGRLSAVIGSLLFVVISGFGRLVPCGNYNFLTPYSHHFTYGFVLSLAALACIHLPLVLRRGHVSAAGLLVGLVLLTKVEFALAAMIAVVLGFALRTASERRHDRLSNSLLLAGSVVTFPVLAFALLCLRLPVRYALRGALGSIYWTFNSRITSLPFYRSGLGLDDVSGNLRSMIIGTLLITLAFALAVSLAYITPVITGKEKSKAAAAVSFVLVLSTSVLTISSPHWFSSIPRALPVGMVLVASYWCIAYLRASGDSLDSQIIALRFVLAVFAFVLLGKMILNTRLYHYGFVLAVPALLLLVAAFISWVPKEGRKRGLDGGVVRAVGLAFVIEFGVIYVGAMIPLIQAQRFPVGSGANAFLADERGAAAQIMVKWIEQHVGKDQTLAVVPEGAMINFLTRRSNPTPHSIFMPPEMLVFGESQMLEAFKINPPDFVLICHKDTTEFGVPLFGRDYGQNIGRWIRENYTPIARVGDWPLQDPDRFGMLLMRRNTLQ